MTSQVQPQTEDRYVVASVSALPPGSRQVLEVHGREIAIFNDQGRIHALRNVCPHHGAPLCAGRVQGHMRPSEPHEYDYSGDDQEDRVVLCPWHGYKFRLSDGRSATDSERLRVRTYRTAIEGDEVVVYV